jgi:hypothetical protein
MRRLVAAEALDHLAPGHPAARRSRRDLLRVHRVMGTRAIVARAWQDLVPVQRSNVPLRILEIGAGDGRLLLGVARTLAPRWPPVRLTLLDRQDLVSPATVAAYADLGWTITLDVADVLGWAARERAAAARWDLISANLFLHHFQGGPLAALLAAVAARANGFFACEPKRSWLALTGSHLVGAIGANAVTREDAVLSVQAGFCARELSAQWPREGPAWQTQEFSAGLFSHCFSARRAGASA